MAEPEATEFGPLPHAFCIEGGCSAQEDGLPRCAWNECLLGMSDVGGERCQACGEAYDEVYILPNDVWEAISPKPENPTAGLLCPCCALDRVVGLLRQQQYQRALREAE